MKDSKYYFRLVTAMISIYVIAGILANWIKGNNTEVVIIPINIDADKEVPEDKCS